MTLAELNAARPGPGRWPNLIGDAHGSHSRECDHLLDIADAELNSEQAAHNLFNRLQRGKAHVTDAALRVFVGLIESVARRNPDAADGPMSKHKARLLAWALLDRWIQASA